ncbi:MAG: M1 family aminopeptidase [candidate division Zixibacteria bacterium]|nr:M1 family aminopeptidase [candidate division Zixibacteria bacterium]
MYKGIRFIKFSLILLVGIFFSQTSISQDTSALSGTEISEVYNQLKALELDPAKIARVENLVLKKNVATFHLKKGEIYLAKPVSGKITGAVFVGEGFFEFSPANDIEKYQLEKFTTSSSLKEEFDKLYLRFSDSTDKELLALSFEEGNIPGEARDVLNSGRKRVKENLHFNTDLIFNLDLRILSDMVGEERKGMFWAEISLESGKRIFFLYDPKDFEEIKLMQEFATGISPALPKGIDLVCSFENEVNNKEDKDEIKINHYRMDTGITSSGNLSSACEVDLSFIKSGLRIITFDMAEKLEVSQVKDESGKELSFVQEKGFTEVGVILENLSIENQTAKLTFTYSGDVMNKNIYGDYYMESSSFWYPQYGYNRRATFDLTFRTPKGFGFISIGEKVVEKKEKDFLLTRWVEDKPVAIASFNMGSFEVMDFKNEGLPDVSVYHVAESHRQFTSDYNRLSVIFPEMDLMAQDKHIKENIGADVINSLNFFQNVFGKCPFKKISVTEIPTAYGQGFPGLLHLSWVTFQNEVKGATEYFRAHEVSHQWWGHIVGWKDYHDQWLSEGLSTYSGAWYTQMYFKDNKTFFNIIEHWKNNILGKGDFNTKGTKAGPLWLGYRLDSSKSLDYHILVYQKGAYVIHMLRNMMMDFKTMSDDKFTRMMQDFVQTYNFKEASTEDFKRIVDKHFGEDMGWFFDQWVYGIEIPTYVVSWEKEQTEDGKFIVNLKVKQENVAGGFKMVVPVVLNFGEDRYSIYKVLVDKPLTEIKLPKVPLSPKGIVFNPFNSVLCEVKYK